ncbi:MAG: hypothetical protein MUC81_02435 [Bacteroidia bacterium]|jgi:hypothetical protein|nr:hypothetical protein [Bacteroidia bacterium]
MNLKKQFAKELWNKSESAKNELDNLMTDYQNAEIPEDAIKKITTSLKKLLHTELATYIKLYDLNIPEFTRELMEQFHFIAEKQIKSTYLLSNNKAIRRNKEIVDVYYPTWKALFHKEKDERTFKYVEELKTLLKKGKKASESEHTQHLIELKNYIGHVLHDKTYSGTQIKLSRPQDEEDGIYDPATYWSKFNDNDIYKIREQFAYIKNSNINPDRYGEDEYSDDFNALVVAKALIEFEAELSKLLNDSPIQSKQPKLHYSLKDKTFYAKNATLFKSMIKGLQKNGLLDNDPKVVKNFLFLLGLEQADKNHTDEIRWLGDVKGLAALFFKLIDGEDAMFSDTKNTRYGVIAKYFVDNDHAPIDPRTIKQYFHKYRSEAEILPPKINNLLKPLTDRYTEAKKSKK